jgi:hypothetical protein
VLESGLAIVAEAEAADARARQRVAA